MLDEADAGRLPALHFLDLDTDVVERELQRSRDGERPGPHAENILRDLGIVAGGAGMSETRFYQTGTFAVGNRLLERPRRRYRPTPSAPTRSPRATAPARAAARRSARATRSTPRCAPPAVA